MNYLYRTGNNNDKFIVKLVIVLFSIAHICLRYHDDEELWHRTSKQFMRVEAFVSTWQQNVVHSSNRLRPNQHNNNIESCRRMLFFRPSTVKSSKMTLPLSTNLDLDLKLTLKGEREKLILWRGEGSAGYSMQFRHLELSNVLSAILGVENDIPLNFRDALFYDGNEDMSTYHMDAFQGAMQFVDTTTTNALSSKKEEDGNSNHDDNNNHNISSDILIAATKRCSLIRASYEILAEGDEYEELASQALLNGSLDEFMVGGENENKSWRVRLRQYGSLSANGKGKRYGKNMRSPLSQERYAVNQMEELFLQFGGNVDLKTPDCSLYIFEGLTTTKKKVLAKLLTKGPNTSFIAPKTRICVTNTPLCPIAAYTMCNLARVKDGQKILDPYAGSCAILLAAAMITCPSSSSIRTVGIEISHNGIVNRNDIVKDFRSRNLAVPAAIICGDSTNSTIRQMAREAASDGTDTNSESSFDLIITDPPYGIRESSKGGSNNNINDDDDSSLPPSPPLDQLFQSILEDRENGTRLLKVGGRLVAFVPNIPGQDVMTVLPSQELTNRAGMKLQETKEQPLNDSLSRWLVAYTCER